MLFKNVKTEYEKHRIAEYNIQRTKVFFVNREMRRVYGNVYIGRPREHYETMVCKVYVYYKEHNIGFCVCDNRSIETSVKDILEMINRRQMRTAEEYIRCIDNAVFSFNEVNKHDWAVAVTIDPSREKIYQEFLKVRSTLILKQWEERKSMRQASYNVIKTECDKINAMLEKLKNGEDFETLKELHSDDTDLKNNKDGYYFTHGEFKNEFEYVAFELKEGEISEIITTSLGFHIVKRLPIEQEYVNKNLEQLRKQCLTAKYYEMVKNTQEKFKPEYTEEFKNIKLDSFN